ncbi:chaperonin Cpn60/TCP-1, partial [Atractiella rhizophila]
AELLKECRSFIEEGVAPGLIIRGYRKACQLAVQRIKELAVSVDKMDGENYIDLLLHIASTALSSKLLRSHKPFFSRLAVNAVLSLDQESLDPSLIGIKKLPGGAFEDSFLVKGVAFKKTFSYAGFEQQPKKFGGKGKGNKIGVVCLNVELELKAERDNAEVRIEQVEEYQRIVDAEWTIIFRKLEAIVSTGAKVVLSRLPIGDLATQYFADRDIFCAGRVTSEDIKRVSQATGAAISTTCTDLNEVDKETGKKRFFGLCETFEERQIGGERFNFFEFEEGGERGKGTCTLILRGGAEQFIEEVERSLNDAIMVVKRAVKNTHVVAGGGAAEMEISKYLRDHSRTIEGKQQLIIAAFAKALEIIPRQLCDNAGIDSTDVLNKLRMLHHSGRVWAGVDLDDDAAHGVSEDNMVKFIWEPSLVKLNALEGATEAACLILSVDETVQNPKSEQAQAGPRAPPGAGRGVRGRGRGRGGFR